jgi:hypothetical protein
MNTILRKSVLGIAGLAFAGGAVAGPMTAAHAAPAAKPVAAVQNAPTSAKQVNIDYQAQPNFYYCGPASTRIALTAQGKTPSQDEVAKQLGTTQDGTNSAEDTTRVLNSIAGGNFYKTTAIPDQKASGGQTDKLTADVVHAVDTGHVVVANIAGTVTDTDGTTHSYEGGHYLTVVGYRDNGKTVQIADPASPDKATYWVATGDLANWVATRGYSA